MCGRSWWWSFGFTLEGSHCGLTAPCENVILSLSLSVSRPDVLISASLLLNSYQFIYVQSSVRTHIAHSTQTHSTHTHGAHKPQKTPSLFSTDNTESPNKCDKARDRESDSDGKKSERKREREMTERERHIKGEREGDRESKGDTGSPNSVWNFAFGIEKIT